ncbi:hypothetical protein, partial [Moraxella catarrhalis]|uniref:hypothetical protein n=1 Tax=Moraxella catarrhalis TaxID=480 RepID=UPI001EED6000
MSWLCNGYQTLKTPRPFTVRRLLFPSNTPLFDVLKPPACRRTPLPNRLLRKQIPPYCAAYA